MPRKRKIAVQVLNDIDEDSEPADGVPNIAKQHGPMVTIMSNIQSNETFHNKYIKEMKQLYLKMDHDAFMFTFIKMIKTAMAVEESNEYANNTLIFCAKFVSSYDGEDTHSILLSTFKFLLSTISNNPHIRFRLCQFVNMVLNALGVEAALDDTICDNILTYMVDRLRDMNPSVRVQAILALQRLQIPDNPDDIVVKTYQFHLSSDPSSRVRQAVITSMGRNYNTIPYILERLWDIDEKVRRHTYLHMSSYPVKAYKVSQRLTFLEQGLNDRSDMVRKVVTTVMLPQWLESYSRNIISLVSGLKLDANEAEIDRFRKITKKALFEIFKRQNKEDLVSTMPLEEDSEYDKCVPFEKLTMEVALYWLCLNEYLQMENADELDSIIPELSTFCNYVQKYCESARSDMDKWQKMEYQYILLTLMEIVSTFDLADEIGRENLKALLRYLLINFDIEERTIKVVIQCTENLITKAEDRLQFFVDIIKELTDAKSLTNELSHDRTLIDQLLEKHPEKKDLKFTISSLKVKMLELEEQETNFVQRKDYAQAQRIAEELNACREEFTNVLKPILNQASPSNDGETRRTMSLTFQQKKLSPEALTKALQISYYMVASKNVKSLTLNVCDLYKDFIRRHVESNHIAVREWALKCGTAYSMLYEPLSKDVYNELYSQFYKNHIIKLWRVSIECIFELIDRYGCSHFEVEDKHNKSRKAGRQLYNTMESIDAEEEPSTNAAHGVDLIFMMSHFLDTCDDVCIINALVVGFCRLILHGHIKNDDIIEKLLLKYFNPATDNETNQILGVFFENLIKRKKQQHLQPCLLPTISTIMSAPYDSPLHEIKPEVVLRFVVDSTRPIYCKTGLNVHDTIAMSFIQEMQNNISNKELLKLLSKELPTLEVLTVNDNELRDEMKAGVEKLLQCDIDPRTSKYLGNFRDILDGTFNPSIVRNTTGKTGASDEELEDGSDEESENRLGDGEKANKDRQTNNNILDALLEEPEGGEMEGDKTTETNNLNPATSPEANTATTEQQSITSATEQESNKSVTEQLPNISTIEEQPNKSVIDQLPNLSTTEKEFTEETQLQDKRPINEKEAENIDEPPRTPQQMPSEQQTPTTFGKDNTTNLRYLRKSMNVHQRSLEELSTKKPKLLENGKSKNIRARRSIQKSPAKEKSSAVMEASISSDNGTSEDGNTAVHDKSQDSRISDDAPMQQIETSSQSVESDDFQPLVLSEEEVVASECEEDAESARQDNASGEVIASSTIVVEPLVRPRRGAGSDRLNAQQVSKGKSKFDTSTEKKKNSKSSKKDATTKVETIIEANPRGEPRRRQRLFNSPGPTKDSNKKPTETPSKRGRPRKSVNNKEINTESGKKPEKNNKTNENVNKSEKSKQHEKEKTNEVDNRKSLDINSVISTKGGLHRTRSATKQEFCLNNIITRRKASLEKSPKRNQSNTPSYSSSNKENTVQSSSKKTIQSLEKSKGEHATKTSGSKNNDTSKKTNNSIEKSRKLQKPEDNTGNKSRTEIETFTTPRNRKLQKPEDNTGNKSPREKKSQSVPKPKSNRIASLTLGSSSVQKTSTIGTRSRSKK